MIDVSFADCEVRHVGTYVRRERRGRAEARAIRRDASASSGSAPKPRDQHAGRRSALRRENHHRRGEWRFRKPSPDAQSLPPEGHKALVSRETVAEVPLTGVSFILWNSFP